MRSVSLAAQNIELLSRPDSEVLDVLDFSQLNLIYITEGINNKQSHQALVNNKSDVILNLHE